MPDLTSTKLKYIAQVSPTELACRMVEAANGIKRPASMSASQCISALSDDDRAWIMICAETALQYISECFSAANRVS